MLRASDSSMSSPNTITDRPWFRLFREPLLHFLVLGALVFAIDYALSSGEDNAEIIAIGAGVDAELKEIFRASRGRDPDAAELQTLRQRWIDNEVLYREGLSLRLDQGDSSIRERVIFKALNVMQANLQLPSIDEAGLQQWFEQNRARYDEPERVDFLEAVIEGKPTLETVGAFVEALNADADSDVQSGLRIFRGRPRASIVASFGEEFTAALAELPVDRWLVMDSTDGPRAIRIEKRTPGAPADFAAVREAVVLDWRDRRMQELRTEAVRELARKYTIKVPNPDPQLVAAAASGVSQ
jgi:hypothetical protein